MADAGHANEIAPWPESEQATDMLNHTPMGAQNAEGTLAENAQCLTCTLYWCTVVS